MRLSIALPISTIGGRISEYMGQYTYLIIIRDRFALTQPVTQVIFALRKSSDEYKTWVQLEENVPTPRMLLGYNGVSLKSLRRCD